MKKLSYISIIIIFCLVTIAFARIIAKDSTPGGIYIIGPDVSPDSTDLTLLYYSPDAGTTLIIRDTLDWIEPMGIAADCSLGIVYMSNVYYFYGVYFSSDSGRTWEHRGDYGSAELYNCDTTGALIVGYPFFSFDYGFTVRYGERIGIPTMADREPYSLGGGLLAGEVYYVSVTGKLFYSWCYADTFEQIDSTGRITITAGNLPGELWAINGSTLMFSEDHGTTFTDICTIPIPFGAFIRGKEPGELFMCHIEYNEIPMEGIFGGTIRICHTDNYGENFNCLTHSAESTKIFEGVSKSPAIEIKAFPNPFNSVVTIKANEPTRIQIISTTGRCIFDSDKISSSFKWKPEDISSSIYLIKDVESNITKKIIYIR